MDIARTITKRLKELDKTQTWLAQQIDVSRQQVSMFLNGKSTMSQAKFMKMLKALRLEIRPKE